MEPPPPSLSSTAVASTSIPAATTTVPHVTSSYPESLDSSPRSRTTDGWDDLPAPSGGGGGGSTVSSKIRLMCSYGGHILPRPHDKSLCYMGGDTRIVVGDRNTSLSSLLARLSNTLLDGRSFTLKYQLPSEDLDSLISVTTDEDLDNMIEEYDRTISASNSTKPSRLRLFLFTSKPEAMGQILESSAKSDDWFLNALNSAGLLNNRGFCDSDTNVNRLLGLDHVGEGDGSVKSAKQQQPPPPQPQGGQDVHCLPDSPMLDTSSSSFGSTSSSPSLANLPPIRVHVEEPSSGVRTLPDQRNLGIEEQFARFNVGRQDDGFAAMSSPPPMPVTIALPAATVSNESHTRVISDDERSDHGVPAGYRKPPTPRSQPQNLQAHQLKSNSELPSPNSVSSDSSVSNPMFHQRPSVYQEPIAQMSSAASTVVTGMINPSDPSTLLSPNQNQNQDLGYNIFHPQFEQQSQPQQQQHFIHTTAAPQYIHHHPSSGLPLQTYIQVYSSQQQPPQSFHHHPDRLDHQPYPVYYVTAPVPPRPYCMPVPQSATVSEAPGSLSSNHLQAPPNSTMMPPPPSNHMTSVTGGKPEVGQAGIYTTAPGVGGAQMVHQIPTSQQQFMGYSQIHHPPQSGLAGNPNYGYEYADNAHTQIYYTQPLGHAQYQTMTGPPPAMVMPDGSAASKLPAENMTQQIRSSQPL
ncbi:PREDICTED: leucine-rich repeat extensin-like protein 5 [Camelina sativa]|uniref:Leucine-rich repeat extensin-like protein 5 n=1 Tax=Camelina sativa TaxID=90675 RepID=A0ABM0ZCJ2_CAMSA|nr:PREDICTED: leucine-rich repeat extensin-like protein 5 [Camelina sativa]